MKFHRQFHNTFLRSQQYSPKFHYVSASKFLGNTDISTDGISMGSPIDPTISKFYMSLIENTISKTIIVKPEIHNRYIFITTHSYDEVNKLKPAPEKNSVLNFTTELNI